MVLLNGVKYACERCIRGHRVTTCTHTDQPLTMIKPKGRPTTQCHHCREQRKMKSLHTACTCGKKSKSGSHSSSCACHLTSHCTCTSNSKKVNSKDIHHMTASEKAKKNSLIHVVNDDLKKKSSSSSSPVSGVGTNGSYVIEDIVLPFETNAGLFDLFKNGSLDHENITNNNNSNNNSNNSSNSNINNNNNNGNGHVDGNNNIHSDGKGNLNHNGSCSNDGNLLTYDNYNNNVDLANQIQSAYDYDNQSLTSKSNSNYDSNFDSQFSPTEAEMADTMFPLFPLIGNTSFNNNKNLPLLGLPKDFNQVDNSKKSNGSTLENNLSNPFYGDNPRSNNSLNLSTPLNPKPVRPKQTLQNLPLHLQHSTSNSTPTSYHQPKPKRPESVLSMASNSSARSVEGLSHSNSFLNGEVQNSSISAAYPPSFSKHTTLAADSFDRVNSSTNISLINNFLQMNNVTNPSIAQEEDDLLDPSQFPDMYNIMFTKQNDFSDLQYTTENINQSNESPENNDTNNYSDHNMSSKNDNSNNYSSMNNNHDDNIHSNNTESMYNSSVHSDDGNFQNFDGLTNFEFGSQQDLLSPIFEIKSNPNIGSNI